MLQHFTPERVIIFYLDTLNRVGVFFSDDFSSPLRRLLEAYLKWFMSQKQNRKVGWTAAETGKPTQPLFHCGVSRDGRDYGRITLHNMDTLNQIKEETIKARVKATAVSSFICLPPPASPEQECCPQLNCFHPQSPLIWDPHKPSFFYFFGMNTGQKGRT